MPTSSTQALDHDERYLGRPARGCADGGRSGLPLVIGVPRQLHRRGVDGERCRILVGERKELVCEFGRRRFGPVEQLGMLGVPRPIERERRDHGDESSAKAGRDRRCAAATWNRGRRGKVRNEPLERQIAEPNLTGWIHGQIVRSPRDHGPPRPARRS